MKAVTIFALVAAVAIELVTSAPEVKICQPGSYRIPHVLAPSKYVMRIHPNLEEKTYKGSVSISLEKTDGRSPRARGYTAQALLSKMGMSQWESIAINVDRKFVELDLEEMYYRTYGNVVVDIKSVCYDDANSRVLLTLKESIFDPSVSGGWLNLDFTGKLPASGPEDKAVKVFDSSMKASKKFPCIDDPELKTALKVSVVISEGQTAVSNIGKATVDRALPEALKFVSEEPVPLDSLELSVVLP